jgi:hypothetical protein
MGKVIRDYPAVKTAESLPSWPRGANNTSQTRPRGWYLRFASTPREYRRLHCLATQRGGVLRRRAIDLAIALTANPHGVPLLTYNAKNFQMIADKVDLRHA